MRIFISYARENRFEVDMLRSDLEQAQHDVWIDSELTGGQSWWDAILDAIQKCDVFIVALSPGWLASRASAAEYEFALACRRSVLPVMVATVDPQLAPSAVAETQILDYRQHTPGAAIQLVMSMATFSPASDVSVDPTSRPPAPISYLGDLRERVEAAVLDADEQLQLGRVLSDRAANDDLGRESALALLERLRARPDLVATVAVEIDRALAAQRVVTNAEQPAASVAVPTPRPVTMAEFESAGASSTPKDVGPLDTLSFALLVVACVSCIVSIVPVGVGLANLRHPARQKQSVILIAVGLPFTLLFVLLVVGLINGGDSTTPSTTIGLLAAFDERGS